MNNSCGNCAWYCHADGRCYGCGAAHKLPAVFAIPMPPEKTACGKWQFDGLEDWERTEMNVSEVCHG